MTPPKGALETGRWHSQLSSDVTQGMTTQSKLVCSGIWGPQDWVWWQSWLAQLVAR